MAITMVEHFPMETPQEHIAKESDLHIPKGFNLRDWKAYESPEWIVLVGEVDEEDERHNCDEMGCGWEHVLWRFRKTSQ